MVNDFATKREASVDDAYAWGSGTKPLTGASILKLIAEHRFDLESPIAPLLDPILRHMSEQDPSQKFKSMGDLWGADNVSQISIGQMLNMTSGIVRLRRSGPRPPLHTCLASGCCCYSPCAVCVPRFQPDFDTAKPWPRPPMDPFRAMCYAKPAREWAPVDLLNVSWVATGKLDFLPGTIEEIRLGPILV